MFEELLTSGLLSSIGTYGVLGIWTLYNLFTIEQMKKDAKIREDGLKELITSLKETIKENTQVLAKVNENMLVCQASHR